MLTFLRLGNCWRRGKAGTSVELAVVGDHEHDFPFEDVVVYQADAYALDAVFGLHELVLVAQEERCAARHDGSMMLPPRFFLACWESVVK